MEWTDYTILGGRFRIWGCGTDAAFHAIRTRAWGEFDFERLRGIVREDSVCLDLGASYGLFSLALSQVALRGWVYAVEGDVETAVRLRRTADAAARITVWPCILGIGGPVEWVHDPHSSTSSHVGRVGEGEQRTQAVDYLFRDLP